MNLSTSQIVLIAFAIVSTLESAFIKDTLAGPIGLALSLLLFGLTLYFEHEKERKADAVDQRIKELSDKIQAIQMQRGMGR